MREWMSIGTDKPEVGKTYIVFTLDGQYQIKRYVKGFASALNKLTADLSLKPHDNKNGETDEGFISPTGWIGRKSTKVVLFYELPAVPESLNEVTKQRAKIAALEAEARRLKKQLATKEA